MFEKGIITHPGHAALGYDVWSASPDSALSPIASAKLTSQNESVPPRERTGGVRLVLLRWFLEV